MTDEQLAEALEAAPNGANIFVTWERPVYLKKAYQGMPFTKHTKKLCRVCVTYDKTQPVKDKRESGELPKKNAGLKGFEWIDAPTLLRSLKNGKTYLRLQIGTFKNKKVVTYKIDGQVVDFANWQHAILAKEKPKEKTTFNVAAENLISIHRYSIEETEEDETETV